ncbi:unnamed protein product [Caenorhabditis angaria]|uniref:Uncharacterized protein n=1 Tax=Caenorhabditis angaria TaxID=860376 RepID=A0A9P1IFN4_9PELO|nr:unnamed protein product [Caenorhabditis angaria]
MSKCTKIEIEKNPDPSKSDSSNNEKDQDQEIAVEKPKRIEVKIALRPETAVLILSILVILLNIVQCCVGGFGIPCIFKILLGVYGVLVFCCWRTRFGSAAAAIFWTILVIVDLIQIVTLSIGLLIIFPICISICLQLALIYCFIRLYFH